jgi:hypothetical protein
MAIHRKPIQERATGCSTSPTARAVLDWRSRQLELLKP